MKRKSKTSKKRRSSASSWGSKQRQQERKTQQLCHQVAETLALTLTDDPDAEGLDGLVVESVDPAPNASRLLVTLRDIRLRASDALDDLYAELVRQQARLRFEIASAINRKKTPSLAFRIIPAESN